ncbi:hypothetical protein L1887_54980 [Cichorium endivia]|nr:hypothetical protein L1887_54980 [Cichorium endivia]
MVSAMRLRKMQWNKVGWYRYSAACEPEASGEHLVAAESVLLRLEAVLLGAERLLLVDAVGVPVALLLAHHVADGVGRNVLWVLEHGGAAEAALEHADGREHHARADLDQLGLLVGLLLAATLLAVALLRLFYLGDRRGAWIRLDNLVVAEPNLVVEDGEGDDVVDKRLGLARAAGHAKHLREHLLDERPVRLLVKLLVETENRARALETVAGHLELVHGVNVLHLELGRRSIGRLGRPHVQILALPRLKVERVVAVVELGELVEHVQLRLGIELAVLLGMWHERLEVIDEVAHARRDASRGQHEHPLLVPADGRRRCAVVVVAIGLALALGRLRGLLVYGRHGCSDQSCSCCRS